MQRPTCTNIRIRSTADAHVIFHAVTLGLLPMVTRRLDTDERRCIQPGCVFVWEERGSSTDNTVIGIERWTDSIRWGPSRVKDEFLYYQERDTTTVDKDAGSVAQTPLRTIRPRVFNRGNLIKQTYSVFVDTPRGRRKWHLIAYFTQDSQEELITVDDMPKLAAISVPPDKYRTARACPRRSPNADIYTSSYEHSQPFLCYSSVPRNPTVYNMSIRESAFLAPLEYLRFLPQPRRHAMDEKALMSFKSV